MELAEAVLSETVSDIRLSIQGPHGPIVFFQLSTLFTMCVA